MNVSSSVQTHSHPDPFKKFLDLPEEQGGGIIKKGPDFKNVWIQNY